MEVRSGCFKQRGGARSGGINYSWPLASLTLDENTLTLTILGKRKAVSKADVRIAVANGIFSEGIRITTRNSDHTMVFWTFNLGALLDALRSRHYEIDPD
jgi:hypothetical protein